MLLEHVPPRNARRFAGARLASLVVLLGLGACSAAPSAPHEREEARTSGAIWREHVQALRGYEDALRSSFSPGEQPAWLDVSGSDPYRIVPRNHGFSGILRGSRAFVTLDADLHELDRLALPESPTALCASVNTDEAWVASRYGSQLLRIRLGGTPAANVFLEQRRVLPVAGVADLACDDDGVVYVLPADGSELLTLDAAGWVVGRMPALPGALRLQKTRHYLLESSLFERSLRVLELDRRGVPGREVARIHHDGTIWAFDAVERGGDNPELVLAIAGVEDKPLVRAHGEFENIDSFVWLYRLGQHGLEQLQALNVSDFGLVVPKALLLDVAGQDLRLTALAAGSGAMLQATWSGALGGAASVRTLPIPPGVSAALSTSDGGFVYASPLFDAWIKQDRWGTHFSRVDPERRPEPDVRLGEALFFTELMAPNNTSSGTHSRFSCETCHFEGGVDGRTHYTGRGDVSVVTKPLFGLANNRPHFSRALDPDLSSVSHNEFRVAGAGSGTEPWATLETSRFEWLHELGVDRAQLSPLELRAALLKFLYAFSHAPNARSQGREHFSELEARGASAFRQHCEGCHAARLLSDDEASAVPFAAWEGLIFSRNAPLVWARGDYAKTGVVPYVHTLGTRITSLRRLGLKPRYFANGSAPDLGNVLERFREAPDGALHDAGGAAQLEPLPKATRDALLAFLRLL